MGIIKVGLGHSTDATEAATQAMEETPKPGLVICFACFGLDVPAVYEAVRAVVGETVSIIGGSSSGEFSSLIPEPTTGTVMVLTIQSSYFSVGVGVGEGLSAKPEEAASQAIRMAHDTLLANPAVMSLMAIALDSKGAAEVSRLKSQVNLVLPDGTSGQEEAFLRGLIRKTGITAQVIGGSTGNDLQADHSFQICNGVYKDSAVVASFSSGLKMGTAMGHPYQPAGKGAVVTSAKGRVVHTLNGKPAAEVLQRLLESDELTPELFIQNPFGIKSSDVFGEYTIKSAQAVNDDGSVSFYAEIPQGEFLREMKTDPDTARRQFRETLENAIIDAGCKKVAAVLVFNCILRHDLKCRLGVDDVGLIKEVCGDDVTVVGFNTFGEQGATLGGSMGHYNQTATVLVIAEEVITQ